MLLHLRNALAPSPLFIDLFGEASFGRLVPKRSNPNAPDARTHVLIGRLRRLTLPREAGSARRSVGVCSPAIATATLFD